MWPAVQVGEVQRECVPPAGQLRGDDGAGRVERGRCERPLVEVDPGVEHGRRHGGSGGTLLERPRGFSGRRPAGLPRPGGCAYTAPAGLDAPCAADRQAVRRPNTVAPYSVLVKRLALLCLAAAAAGCVPTFAISRSEPADLALLDERMRGRRARVTLADGAREEGVVLFVRADSTAWRHLLVRRAAPTDSIVRMVRHGDWRSLRRGALIGAGVGAALGLAALLGGDSAVYEAEAAAAGMVGGGVAWGLVIGGASGWARAYVLRP